MFTTSEGLVWVKKVAVVQYCIYADIVSWWVRKGPKINSKSCFSEHEHVMRREKEYKGIWINSNMKSHESFKDSKCQVDRAVVEITSPDGSNKRKLGMLGVLSDVEGLYKPDAFGGKFFLFLMFLMK